MKNSSLTLRKVRLGFRNPTVIALFLCFLILLIGNLVSPGFASFGLIVNILVVASFVGLVSGGQFLIILGGGNGLDLSVGRFVTLGAIIGGVVSQKQDSKLILALLAVMVATFLLGLVNGVGVTHFRIPPLVMTMSMSIVIIAIIRFITGGIGVPGASKLLQKIITGKVLGIPGILYIWILFAVFLHYLMNNTTFGVKLMAMGTNDYAARLAGVKVKRLRTLLYGFSGMIAGITGFLYLGYLSSVYNISLGDKFTLISVIAVVVGGTSLGGGKGTYIGVAIGAFLLQLMESFLVTIRIDQSMRQVLFGTILLVIIFMYGREQKMQN
ncbi:MAG: ABC transporter permease [Sphaerochaetaceae bacterium]|jgi:ribose transport system permease protein|nr:ABC transporter permease [Sphaerochaetaceae bacterium]MDD3365788.1 ABC transporter permease [Sphaerochaetaceae bacterium]MDD4219618.1 ABC transporter permease [Sphaerochaetaceae bacterium]MDY0371855.1 ABC transporter permease [Sphaerochaetaceae bacterium]